MDAYVPDQPGRPAPSFGLGEKWFFAFSLFGIAIWGFSGSWDYPTVERSTPIELVSAPVSVESFEPQPNRLAQVGAALFEENGCYACHSIAGETKIGPSLNGIYGHTVTLGDGIAVQVDDAYILESILNPQAKLVAGFEDAAMPSYEGLVTDSDASALLEYIKSLE